MLEEVTSTPRGRLVLVISIIAVFATSGLAIYKFFRGGDASVISRDRLYIDADTGTPFSHELKRGDSIPVDAPSGKKTGYPAELCYWTADGHVKNDPTPVLMNEYHNDPSPTFCPDCGRLVVGHNPHPKPGDKPPPTREEYARQHQAPPPASDVNQ